MYERNIFLPPSGPAPGVLQTKGFKGQKQNQGYKTIVLLTEKRQTNYSLILSKEKALGSICLLRCAHKHSFCEIQNQKTKGKNQHLKTLRASHLFTVCDTSALACWQYTHLKLVSVSFKTNRCLLRCAQKHSVSALKTKDKIKSVKAFRDIPFGVNTLLPASLRVQILLKSLCLLCYAHKHQKMKYKIKNQRQRPLWSEQYSIVLVICCGHSHHECHACYASRTNTIM